MNIFKRFDEIYESSRPRYRDNPTLTNDNDEDITFEESNIVLPDSDKISVEINLRLNAVAQLETTVSVLRKLVSISKQAIDNGNSKLANDLDIVIKEVSGVEKDIEIVGESSYYTTEGFFSFIGDVWSRFVEIVKGFFRAIFDFVKDLFTGDKDIKDRNRRNKRQVDNLIRTNFNFSIVPAYKVKTKLPDIMCLGKPEPTLVDIYQGAIIIVARYERLIKEIAIPAIDRIKDDIVPLSASLMDVDASYIRSDNDIYDVIGRYEKLLQKTGNLCNEILPYEVPLGKIPPQVHGELFKKTVGDSSKVRSLVNVDDENGRLVRNYNVFGVSESRLVDPFQATTMSEEDLLFAFSTYKEAKNDLNDSFIDGFTSEKQLELLVACGEKIESMNFDNLVSKVRDSERKINTLLDFISTRGRANLVEINSKIKGGVKLTDFTGFIIDDFSSNKCHYTLMLQKHLERNGAAIPDGPVKRFLISDKTLLKAATLASIRGNDPVAMDKAITLLDEWTTKLGHVYGDGNEVANILSGIEDFPSLVSSGEFDENLVITFNMIESVIDKILIGTFTSTMKIITGLGAELPATYKEMTENLESFTVNMIKGLKK